MRLVILAGCTSVFIEAGQAKSELCAATDEPPICDGTQFRTHRPKNNPLGIDHCCGIATPVAESEFD